MISSIQQNIFFNLVKQTFVNLFDLYVNKKLLCACPGLSGHCIVNYYLKLPMLKYYVQHFIVKIRNIGKETLLW